MSKIASEYAIEKGVPLPPRPFGRKLYPFPEMKVKESFFVPIEKNEDAVARSRSMSALAQYWKRKLKAQFSVRREEGGIRVWRVQ